MTKSVDNLAGFVDHEIVNYAFCSADTFASMTFHGSLNEALDQASGDLLFLEVDDQVAMVGDVSDELRAFARAVASSVLKYWDAPDVVKAFLRTGDPVLREAARSAARSAAESAAWSAAWSAAESAARSAAWSAAWSAARSAAARMLKAVLRPRVDSALGVRVLEDGIS